MRLLLWSRSGSYAPTHASNPIEIVMNRPWILLPAIAVLASFSLPAHAYLDPASGSILLQMIVGGVAGVALAAKLFWHRILGFFGAKPKSTDDDAGV